MAAVEISIVTPVYGCADCLEALHRRLTDVLTGLDVEYEVIFVDDRSPDGAWAVLERIMAADPRAKAIRLSRNFGQHAAITAGLAESRGERVVVMDCDLQDPPEHIAVLLAKAREGYDVVLSRRRRRVGPRLRRSTGRAYDVVRNLVLAGDLYSNFTNFSMLSRRAVQAFLTLRDKDRQYLLIVHWIGFERAVVEVEPEARHAGESAYDLRSLLRVAFDGIFFSTTRLLRWIAFTGFAVAGTGMALALYTGIKYLAGGDVSTLAGVSASVLLLSGFLILSTGVMGLYVGKIFDQVKERPLYVVEEHASATETPSADDGVPFNVPYATGEEAQTIRAAIANRHLSGNGPFSRRCAEHLETLTSTSRALLTTSGTSALELAVALAGVGPGDEVIVPSFTFVTTASAVAARGGTPVFVDVREDTLNLDERLVEAAVTGRTKAILPVHYAGFGCDMDALGAIAERHGLRIVEDAAQGIGATWRGTALGAIGDLGCLSFHETKNVSCGEGGALLVNDPELVERAEILWEKGTDRAKFFRGEVQRYHWVDLGSSYLMSDLNAAYLWPQLRRTEEITRTRRATWEAYHEALAPLEHAGLLRRPVVPEGAEGNGHLYHVLFPGLDARTRALEHLASRGVHAVFHYVPLHSSPAGLRYGRAAGELPVTDAVSDRIVRLPFYNGMGAAEVRRVADALRSLPA